MMENSMSKFEATEKLVQTISRYYTTMVLASTFFYITVPGGIQFYAYMTDNVTPTTYVATFRDMHGFV